MAYATIDIDRYSRYSFTLHAFGELHVLGDSGRTSMHQEAIFYRLWHPAREPLLGLASARPAATTCLPGYPTGSVRKGLNLGRFQLLTSL